LGEPIWRLVTSRWRQYMDEWCKRFNEERNEGKECVPQFLASVYLPWELWHGRKEGRQEACFRAFNVRRNSAWCDAKLRFNLFFVCRLHIGKFRTLLKFDCFCEKSAQRSSLGNNFYLHLTNFNSIFVDNKYNLAKVPYLITIHLSPYFVLNSFLCS
jgi:hypothetical protein